MATPLGLTATVPLRGYDKLYAREITQADKGCDFDFLRARPERV